MGQSFQTIQLNSSPQASDINRIQANIQTALGASSSAVVLTVNAANYPLREIPDLLIIPTSTIGGNVTVSLPDATKAAGASFPFKKTDTSSNYVTFISTANNKQGSPQTVENSSSYATNASLAYGWLSSDGNNWWVI